MPGDHDFFNQILKKLLIIIILKRFDKKKKKSLSLLYDYHNIRICYELQDIKR